MGMERGRKIGMEGEAQSGKEEVGILHFAYKEVSVGRSNAAARGKKKGEGNGGTHHPQWWCQLHSLNVRAVSEVLAHLRTLAETLTSAAAGFIPDQPSKEQVEPVLKQLLLSLRPESGEGDVETARSKKLQFPLDRV